MYVYPLVCVLVMLCVRGLPWRLGWVGVAEVLMGRGDSWLGGGRGGAHSWCACSRQAAAAAVFGGPAGWAPPAAHPHQHTAAGSLSVWQLVWAAHNMHTGIKTRSHPSASPGTTNALL